MRGKKRDIGIFFGNFELLVRGKVIIACGIHCSSLIIQLFGTRKEEEIWVVDKVDLECRQAISSSFLQQAKEEGMEYNPHQEIELVFSLRDRTDQKDDAHFYDHYICGSIYSLGNWNLGLDCYYHPDGTKLDGKNINVSKRYPRITPSCFYKEIIRINIIVIITYRYYVSL